MFSAELVQWIQDGYTNALHFLEEGGQTSSIARIKEIVADCGREEQTIMKYYFAAMPYSDLTDTNFEILRKYARHALFLRKNVPWCREIPEKIFLMDVVAYRINNEKIVDCRELFFHEVWDRIKNCSMKEAALEVNYWCAEHATYHLADPRTSSALTVYRSGFGRCGEESVFAVTVLRSVGIPARQVYTPLWAHCDSNHAWVEVWCGDDWYFLGACEPEEVLNRGWFNEPASRAMMLHVKYFTALPLPEAEFTEGFVHYVNRLAYYAHSTLFTVEVVDENGLPQNNVTVYFEVMNGAKYGKIATKVTGADGRTSIELGEGDVRIYVRKDGKWAKQIINSSLGFVQIVLDEVEETEIWHEYELEAPKAAVIHLSEVTQEQEEKRKQRIELADKLRLDRIASFYQSEIAAPYGDVDQRLRASGENFSELIQFLQRDDNPYRMKLLNVLSQKDMYDSEADILEEHLRQAMEYADQFPDEIFVRFLLNPRIGHEELSCYRTFIEEYFSDEQKAEFRANPKKIWKYIQENIHFDESKHFENLRISPKGALELKLADPMSQKTLFCAICRTLGVPARVSFRNRKVEYYMDGEFQVVETEMQGSNAEATLTLTFQPDSKWDYFEDWSLCVQENGTFHPLGLLREAIVDGKMELLLSKGVYELLIRIRMPNGNQLVRDLTFTLHEGEHKLLELTKPKTKLEKQLIEKSISPVTAISKGKEEKLEELAAGKKQMVLWLEPGKEPTQHVLNELLEHRDNFHKLGKQLVILIEQESKRTEPVLSRVLEQLPECISAVPKDWRQSCKIAEELNLQTQYPLVYVKNDKNFVIYAKSGYNAGSIALMLELMEK